VKRLPALAALALAAAPQIALAEWSKTYVVEWNEPAMYYGARTGVIDPGTDCPAGTNPEVDWIKVLVDAGYTLEEAKWLRNPANPTRSPVHGQNQMAFRGKDRANVYVNPTSTPDTGLVGVSGTIGEGIDLDGDATNGFTSPTGEKGVDNTFYKTLGCWKTYRGPQRLSSGALQFNDGMRNGAWTTVIVVAGKGADPLNDPDVKVGFYMSGDKMVKGGTGEIARDYTFRIRPHAKYEAIFAARTANGKIVSTQPADVLLRDPSYTRDLELLRARVALEMKEDGSLTGYVGGYRPWLPVYQGWVNARGPVIESLTWVQLPAVYYALRRSADFSPAGPGGEKTHVSYALRVHALPAYVVDPEASALVASVESYKSIATPERPAPAALAVVDGIVIDRNAKVQAGPNAVILPPTDRQP
jgi:hypothetical protein